MFTNNGEYIPAVNCSDLFKDQIETNANGGFWKEYIRPNYICPDTTSNITFSTNITYEDVTFSILVMPCEAAR